MGMTDDTARDIATPFGEAVADLVRGLGAHLTGDPQDEIERQLEVLIDGAPLAHSDAGVEKVRTFARRIAQDRLARPAPSTSERPYLRRAATR